MSSSQDSSPVPSSPTNEQGKLEEASKSQSPSSSFYKLLFSPKKKKKPSNIFVERKYKTPAKLSNSESPSSSPHTQNEGPLFSICLSENRIHLPSVPLSSTKKVLHKFSLSNVSKYDIKVHLQSDLNSGENSQDQITFQLSNENITQADEDEEMSNQLFNSINLVDTITLKTNETKEVIVAFLPVSRTSSNKLQKIYYTYFPVNGNISISAVNTPFANGKRIKSAKQDIHQNSSIPFSANVCKSYLDTNVQELDFGDCIVGQNYIKDFTIWNRSEIPLVYSITCKAIYKNMVEFTNYETGEMLEATSVIPGHSHMEISVKFTPTKLGDYNIPIFIQNVNDEDNTAIVTLKSVTLSERKDDGLLILDERGLIIRSLDFGDCFTGMKRSKMLTIRNVSAEPIDVVFGADGDSYSKLAFELHTEFNKNQSADSQMFKVKIEELSIHGGDERKIEVWYHPEAHSEAKETELAERKFKLSLKCTDVKQQKNYSKTISCTARVCTSLIEVTPTKINFGDSNIGDVKYAIVQIFNRSDLPARIAIHLESKIITCKTKESIIPPKQTVEVKFRLSPRKVNPYYRKQITIINMNNRENDTIIDVQSNNIDRNKLILHSLFYDVLTSSQQNFAKTIDFGTHLLNDVSMRSFVVKNTTKADIKLGFKTSSSKEIGVFTEGFQSEEPLFSQKLSNYKEKFLETIEKRSGNKAKNSESDTFKSLMPQPASDGLRDYLKWLNSAFESIPSGAPLEENSSNEETYVRFIIELRKSLERAVSSSLLAQCTELSLQPGEEKILFVVFKPLSEQRQTLGPTLRKIEEKLFIYLKEFDKSLIQESNEMKEIPPRELSIHARLCRSMMGVTQRHINFGNILTNEEKNKVITLSNMGEVPLLYKITKRGSIASADLIIESPVYGIIRAYGSRDVNICFKPSLAGKFEETITFENVQDNEASKILTVKALIERLEKFTVKQTEINFGTVSVDQCSQVRRIVVTNTTKNKRTFELRFELKSAKYYHVELAYDLKPPSFSAETEKLEAELEKLEHKYRIAVRKQKSGKVKKLAPLIEEIKKTLSFEVNEEDSFMTSDSGEESSSERKRFKRTEQGIRFAVPGNAIQVINITAAPRKIKSSFVESVTEKLSGKFVIFESNNADTKKKVTFSLQVNTEDEEDLLPKPESAFKPMLAKPITIPEKPRIAEENFGTPGTSAVQKQSTLVIHPLEIDLGRITVGEIAQCKVKIQNTSATSTAGFVILSQVSESGEHPMKFNFSKKNAVLGKKESCVVDIACEPQSIGSQRHKIQVQNLATKQIYTLLVTCNPHRPPPVKFPDLIAQGGTKLDYGFCYISSTKTFSKVVPFTIENKKDTPLTFDVMSNSPNQVQIYQDDELTKPALSVSLPPYETIVTYVCMKPYLSEFAAVQGNCRVLTGGLRVKIFDNKHAINLYERVIPFKCIVGYSFLKCSAKLINFGSTNKIGEAFSGKFTLSNANTVLPLEYSIEAPGSIHIASSDVAGKLDAADGKGKSSKVIQFTMQTASYGLNSATITVRNKMNDKQAVEVISKAFVDGKRLDTDLPKNASGIDSLTFSDVYVNLLSDAILKQKISVVGPTESEVQNFLKSGSVEKKPSQGAIQVFTLFNSSEESMVILPQSDCEMLVVPTNLKEVDIDQQIYEGLVDGNKICNKKAYELPAKQKSEVVVVLKGIPTIDNSKTERLKQYQKASISGALLINKLNNTESQVIKIIDISVDACVSHGTLEYQMVNIGKVGHNNSWKTRKFQFIVRNTSEIPLIIQAKPKSNDVLIVAPQPSIENTLRVEPMKTLVIKGSVRVRLLEEQTAGPFFRFIELSNKNNPNNTMDLTVTGTLTKRIWQIAQEDNQIILPLLELPPRPLCAPCDKTFTIVNTSAEYVTTKFEVLMNASVGDMLKIEILNYTTNIPLKEYKFSPKGSLDLRIRCTAMPDAHISKKLIEQLGKSNESDKSIDEPYPATPVFAFAEMRVVGEDQPTERLPILGSLFQLPTFSLSCSRILIKPNSDHKQINRQEAFSIKNVKSAPLHFKVESLIPTNSNVVLSVVPVQGVIEAGGSSTISVFLDSSNSSSITYIPDDVYVVVSDIYAPLASEKLPVQMMFSMDEEQTTSTSVNTGHISPYITPSTPTTIVGEVGFAKLRPVIALKGCTPMGKEMKKFEINMGQQLFKSSKPVEWDLSLSLESSNSPQAEYQIYPISKDDSQWLTLSRSEGTITSVHDVHTVTLKFATTELKVHSTYLILENLSNPKDMKMIRIQMEVVMSAKENGDKFFNVLVDGISVDKNPVLDMGEVFFGNMVRHRYIDIVNTFERPLEFQVTSTSSASDAVYRNLYLSLSFSSYKGFHSLSLDPGQSIRVYTLYKPKRPNPTLSTSPTGAAETQVTKSFIDEFELYIRCRMVKDYQQMVKLKACCLLPQMHVSTSEIVFIGKSNRNVDPASADLTIKNLFKEPLKYEVRTDYCLNFEVITPKKCVITGKTAHTISVRPIISKIYGDAVSSQINANQHNRLIEEHFTIYNRKNLKEKWWILIRFSMNNFSLLAFPAPGSKSGYAFSSLEDNIFGFLREFNTLVDKNLSPVLRGNPFEALSPGSATIGELRLSIQTPTSNGTTTGLSTPTSATPVIEKEEDLRSVILKVFQKKQFTKLYFDLHYLTDELVFYGLKGKVGQNFFDLAKLLYGALLGHSIFGLDSLPDTKTAAQSPSSATSPATPVVSALMVPEIVKQWGGQLSYFLSYFPDKREEVKMLRELLLKKSQALSMAAKMQ